MSEERQMFMGEARRLQHKEARSEWRRYWKTYWAVTGCQGQEVLMALTDKVGWKRLKGGD